jgi:hypothetical protein
VLYFGRNLGDMSPQSSINYGQYPRNRSGGSGRR